MHVIGRNRHARSGGGSRPITGSYLIAIRTISPSPPASASRFLFTLPSSHTLQPTVAGSGIDYTFMFPSACTLTHAHLHGDARTLRSYNTLGVGGVTPHDVDLYVDGTFVKTLLTLSAGATTVDVHSTPDVAIGAGSEVQFVVPVEANATGSIMNFFLAIAVG